MTTVGPVRVAADGRDDNLTIPCSVAALAVRVSRALPLARRHNRHDLLAGASWHLGEEPAPRHVRRLREGRGPKLAEAPSAPA
jgi:hypothetical protein